MLEGGESLTVCVCDVMDYVEEIDEVCVGTELSYLQVCRMSGLLPHDPQRRERPIRVPPGPTMADR